MTTHIADDHAAIKARMEEIAQERQAPHEYTPEPKEAGADMLTLDWAIYAPVNVNG